MFMSVRIIFSMIDSFSEYDAQIFGIRVLVSGSWLIAYSFQNDDITDTHQEYKIRFGEIGDCNGC